MGLNHKRYKEARQNYGSGKFRKVVDKRKGTKPEL